MEQGLMYVWREILGVHSFDRPVWHMAITVEALNIVRLRVSRLVLPRYILDIEQHIVKMSTRYSDNDPH
jgi:hypothetical protein